MSSRVDTAVLTRGPGTSMTLSEKMPTIMSSRYWKSYSVQRCACSDLRVSKGENDVCRADIEDVGETRLRNLDRNLRLMRWGTSSWMERHGT